MDPGVVLGQLDVRLARGHLERAPVGQGELECCVDRALAPGAAHIAAAVEVEELRSATGSVVIRNSERSFTKPRSATTETGVEELNENEPVNVEAPLKGASSKNAAIWPLAGMFVEPDPTSLPLASVKKKDTAAASLFGFAIARPVLTMLVA